METVRFQIARADVYEEVKKTSSYAGAKVVGDEAAYDRMMVKDADEEMLGRFFNEAVNSLTDLLKPFISSTGTSTDFDITLSMPSTFDTNLTTTMQRSMFSYLVLAVTASWYDFVKDDKTETTVKDAAAMLQDVRTKLYYRKPMQRVARTRT